jgi:hypothetical protein
MNRAIIRSTALPVLLLLGLAGCEAKKSANPLSPSIAGPIEGVEITRPALLEPAHGTRLKASQQPIRLLIQNSSTNGVRPVAYVFEVATDSDFVNKAYSRSGVIPGTDGRTSVVLGALDTGKKYYWRVKADDGANSSAFSTAEFDVLPRPQLDPPPHLSPAANAQLSTRLPELVIGRSARNEAIGNVAYEFQIATDVTFSNIVAAGNRSEAGSTTTYNPDGPLVGSTVFYWRVRAFDPEVTSNWSAIQAFVTAAAPAPGPGPGPSPAPNPGGPCNSSSGQAIVECERAKFGFMGSGEIVTFLRNVADSMNRNGISGGRFGLLLKPSGNNCAGYSCDIICSGNGGGQRQWDVLSDVEGTQGAMWAELDSSHITVRACEIR